MQIIKDDATFDALQRYLVRVIAEDVRDRLRLAAASGASLEQAVEAITFSVASIVDGSRHMQLEGDAVRPVLTFGVLDADENLTGVLSSGDSSRLREFAVSIAREAVAS